MKETVLSGMRPTGKLHLGNYFGAAVNYVKMQNDFNCYFMIADFHALTTHTKATELRDSVKQVMAEYIASGIDPDKAALYVQSDVEEVTELYLVLNMFAYKGELEKTATFKEKARKPGQTLNAGLLTYPVLMAADILLHRAHKVPVGKDQEQHIEMTRNFGNRFNHYYAVDFFPEPQGFNFGEDLIKVPALDGSLKMSKSDSEMNAIFLSDSDEEIIKKMKKAKTDLGPKENNAERPTEIQNLFGLMKLVSDAQVYQQFDSAYNDCSIRYGDFKMQIATDMIRFIKPIRERIQDILADEEYLLRIRKDGREKAKESARATLNTVREIVGFKKW